MMRMHALVVLALIVGCGKKADDPAPAPAAPTGPLKLDTKTLWADFHGAIDNIELLHKYHDPCVITGNVSKNGPLAFLDVDGTNKVELEFADKAAAAKLTAGTSATVTCKIGGTGGSSNRLYATHCTL